MEPFDTLLLYFSLEEYECKSELASGVVEQLRMPQWLRNGLPENLQTEAPLLPSFPDLVLTLIHHPHCLLSAVATPQCTCKSACLLLFPLPARCSRSASEANPIFAPLSRMTCANFPSSLPLFYQTLGEEVDESGSIEISTHTGKMLNYE